MGRPLRFALTSSLVVCVLAAVLWGMSHLRHEAIEFRPSRTMLRLRLADGQLSLDDWPQQRLDAVAAAPAREAALRQANAEYQAAFHGLGATTQPTTEAIHRYQAARDAGLRAAAMPGGFIPQPGPPLVAVRLAYVAWPAGILTVAMLACRGLGSRERAERRERGQCPACGYDLRATPHRCPECGADPAAG